MILDTIYNIRTPFNTIGSSKGIFFDTCIIPKMIARLVLLSISFLVHLRCMIACTYIWGLTMAALNFGLNRGSRYAEPATGRLFLRLTYVYIRLLERRISRVDGLKSIAPVKRTDLLLFRLRRKITMMEFCSKLPRRLPLSLRVRLLRFISDLHSHFRLLISQQFDDEAKQSSIPYRLKWIKQTLGSNETSFATKSILLVHTTLQRFIFVHGHSVSIWAENCSRAIGWWLLSQRYFWLMEDTV